MTRVRLLQESHQWLPQLKSRSLGTRCERATWPTWVTCGWLFFRGGWNLYHQCSWEYFLIFLADSTLRWMTLVENQKSLYLSLFCSNWTQGRYEKWSWGDPNPMFLSEPICQAVLPQDWLPKTIPCSCIFQDRFHGLAGLQIHLNGAQQIKTLGGPNIPKYQIASNME